MIGVNVSKTAADITCTIFESVSVSFPFLLLFRCPIARYFRLLYFCALPFATVLICCLLFLFIVRTHTWTAQYSGVLFRSTHADVDSFTGRVRNICVIQLFKQLKKKTQIFVFFRIVTTMSRANHTFFSPSETNASNQQLLMFYLHCAVLFVYFWLIVTNITLNLCLCL